ncbi:MAG: sodium/solute symporter, partial [Flavobacteriaceae bacterium]|nr:sodium/solute symporter [Flavobacteriaceae bacterium]
LWLSFKDKQEGAEDYFLAGKSLPWWAIGGSLIASNISAEQFIGMSGSGYVVGMAIASYELMAAVTLIIVAKYFLPIFLKHGIYTMPQFLEKRFDKRVRSGLAVFWVLLFVFVNITSVLYLGGLALENIMGISMWYGIVGLALFAATFSIFGGLKAVVWTDVIQVVVLILGGLMASYLVLQAIGGSAFNGFISLMEKAPEKFDMILDKAHPEYSNL